MENFRGPEWIVGKDGKLPASKVQAHVAKCRRFVTDIRLPKTQLTQPKPCEFCGQLFKRNGPNESRPAFRKRRFCSHKCAGDAQYKGTP